MMWHLERQLSLAFTVSWDEFPPSLRPAFPSSDGRAEAGWSLSFLPQELRSHDPISKKSVTPGHYRVVRRAETGVSAGP